MVTAAVMVIIPAAPAAARDFRIVDVAAAVDGAAIDFRAVLELPLSEEAAEAVDKGIAVTLGLNIDLLREREWWWDKGLGTWQVRAELRRHRPSGRYLVRVDGPGGGGSGGLDSGNGGFTSGNGEATGNGRSFPSLDAALEHLGRGLGARLPLTESLQLRRERYRLKVKAVVLFDMLPAPLRLWAYVAPSWRMASRASSWPLAP